jgi:hypothetical protein
MDPNWARGSECGLDSGSGIWIRIRKSQNGQEKKDFMFFRVGGSSWKVRDYGTPGAWKSFKEVLEAALRIRIHRIHIFLGLPDPDPLVRGINPEPDPSIIMQKQKEKP